MWSNLVTCIFFAFAMSKKTALITIAITVGIIILLFLIYDNSNSILRADFEDVTKVESSIRISSVELVRSFQRNERKANSRFVEQTLEVTGYVSEISKLNNGLSILLNGNGTSEHVLCEMRPDQWPKLESLKKGDEVIVKGVCKGYLKDAILLHCILLKEVPDD